MIILTFQLLQLHGPQDQLIDINPDQVVSFRKPRAEGHFPKGIRCLVSTVDGKFSTVTEDCETVRARLEAAKNAR
ncbi:hypothetical protein [Bradyrhizobium sp. CCGUVB23]|uniref:hypothetical protein n=1 Tax=Bradyrhizobium sp. CCGUVB23 TaxID=2949630 RepID=UPI0020B1DB69|nr:hypothetical protein [Bradyrhizobium sp. CCGUVB23]MCP3460335.1 hypothetical protein [Bradyrhizobium sp. CCGUVB23]